VGGTEKEVEVETPYANVEVWLPARGRSTKTDANGRFVFRRIPPGEYLVEVREAENKPALATAKLRVPAKLSERVRSVVIVVPP
jgi:hypothetical protein